MDSSKLSIKSLVIGSLFGLIIGLFLGYGFVYKEEKNADLENQITELEKQVNNLKSQIEEKNNRINTLQSRIDKLEENKLLEKRTEIEAHEEVLYYKEVCVWSKEKFMEIIEDQQNFESSHIKQFNDTFNVDDENFVFKYNHENHSTVLGCDIYGTFSGSWYDFHWLLNPLDLDFIESHFVKTEKELSWEGNIDDVNVTINLRFPFTIDHCHAHVWKK